MSISRWNKTGVSITDPNWLEKDLEVRNVVGSPAAGWQAEGLLRTDGFRFPISQGAARSYWHEGQSIRAPGIVSATKQPVEATVGADAAVPSQAGQVANVGVPLASGPVAMAMPTPLPPPAIDAEAQWHLTGSAGINLGNVWDDYTGRGVRVGVLDQGVDSVHPDLNGNYNANLCINALTNTPGGQPVRFADNHGTAVAGVIAAEDNGQGVVGVANGARLVSIYDTLQFANDFPVAQANAFAHAATALDVLNNSWSYAKLRTPFVDNFAPQGSFAGAARALQNAAQHGRDPDGPEGVRDALGTVIVFAAGNLRDDAYDVGSDTFHYYDNTNYHNYQNSRFVTTVAATDSNGMVWPSWTPRITNWPPTPRAHSWHRPPRSVIWPLPTTSATKP